MKSKITKFLLHLHFKNFMFRLFSVFLILIFTCLTLFSFVTYKAFSGLMRNELENSQKIFLEQAESILDKQIQRMNDIVAQLSDDSNAKNLYYMQNEKKPKDYIRIYDLWMNLKYLKLTADSIENIAIIFLEGNSVCSTYGSHPIDYYFSETSRYSSPDVKEFVQEGIYKNFQYITTSELSNYQNTQNVITFGATLPVQASIPQAVILIDMREEGIRELIDNIDKNFPIATAVFDNQDKLMTMYQNIFPENDPFQNFFQKNISHLFKNPPKMISVDGKIYNFFANTEERFRYVSLIPESYISDKIRFISVINIISIVTVLLIATIFSYKIAARFYSPIRQMLSFIQINQRDHRLSESGRNELEFINLMLRYIYHYNDSLNRSLQEEKQIVTERIQMDLLNGSSNFSLYKDSQFSINYPHSHFQVAVIEMERIREQYLQNDPLREQVLEVLDTVSEYLKEHDILFDIIRRHAASFFPVILNFELSDINITIIDQALSEIVEKLTEKFDIFITIGVGKSYDSLKKLRQSYIEALASLNRKEKLGQNQTIYIDEFESSSLYQGIIYPLENERTLINLIKLGDFAQASAYAEQVLESNREIRYQTIYNELFFLLVNSCQRAMLDLGLSAEEASFSDKALVFREIEHPEEKKTLFLNILKVAVEKAKNFHEVKSNRIFEQAVQFIQEHYTENISLQILEEHIGVSASYISHIFSQNSQKSFLDYLNHYRIRKAAELLSSTDKTIQEIAVLCGIPSTNSFNRIFKKYMGTTPGKYRNL